VTTKPTDVLHLVLYAFVAIASVVLVAGHVVSVATMLSLLIAWAGPSAGGALGRLLAGLQPPSAGAGTTLPVAVAPPLAVPFSVPPPRPPPIPAASPRRWLVLAPLALAMACGGSHLTVDDSARVESETTEGLNCVLDNRPDKEKIDACRARVHAVWDAYWRGHFADGGDQ
jgi:hypothetical protein